MKMKPNSMMTVCAISYCFSGVMPLPSWHTVHGLYLFVSDKEGAGVSGTVNNACATYVFKVTELFPRRYLEIGFDRATFSSPSKYVFKS